MGAKFTRGGFVMVNFMCQLKNVLLDKINI